MQPAEPPLSLWKLELAAMDIEHRNRTHSVSEFVAEVEALIATSLLNTPRSFRYFPLLILLPQ